MEFDFSLALAKQERWAAQDRARAEDDAKKADDQEIVLQKQIELAQKQLKSTEELKARYPCEALSSTCKGYEDAIKTFQSLKEHQKEVVRLSFEHAERSAKRVIASKALHEEYTRRTRQISEELALLYKTNDQARHERKRRRLSN